MPDPGTFVSKRFGVRLPLPNGASWKIDDRTTRWLSATQREEESTLTVRLWRDDNRMNRDTCEERARSSRALPSREGAEVVEQRALDLPAGFDTRADVVLLPDPKGNGLYGFILAFGGYSHKCFAYVFVTHAAGPGADRRVGDRLARMVEGSLSRLTFETDFDVPLERDTKPVLY